TYKPNEEEINLLHDLERMNAEECVEENALFYVAGYVAHRFRNRYNLGCSTKTLSNSQSLEKSSWLYFVSKGNYMYPSRLKAMNRDIKHNNTIRKHKHLYKLYNKNEINNNW
ncbi:hypothetical protein X777_06110, partial [Ooceraea biroi]